MINSITKLNSDSEYDSMKRNWWQFEMRINIITLRVRTILWCRDYRSYCSLEASAISTTTEAKMTYCIYNLRYRSTPFPTCPFSLLFLKDLDTGKGCVCVCVCVCEIKLVLVHEYMCT